MDVEEVIRTYIRYNGSRQGLWTDYGEVFDRYLNRVRGELVGCSLFEAHDRPNTLAIRYKYIRQWKADCYRIYRTDDKGEITGLVCQFRDHQSAADKYMELYRQDHPAYRVERDGETGEVRTVGL